MDELPYADWRSAKKAEDLGLTSEIILAALEMAAADARTCTGMDAPSAGGIMFWSRGNRYLREQLRDRLLPEVWGYSNRDSILRTIHPSGAFAVTVISGAGGVGDRKKKVRAKNPKGSAVASLVKRNEQTTLFDLDEDLAVEIEDVDVDDIPTWFILYRMDKNGEIHVELSLPVEMHGKFVDTWLVRIPIGRIAPPSDGGGEIDLNPTNSDEGPDFDVTYKGL
ncbi:hypothetical protein AB0G15_43070 [Streptosporangium sp. NPDC023825]|uniref:hypothetical protein n=1 Tax=Streptosporangium sp. NPDC023825 TaxID=3154909 RepID=UPI003418DA94